MPEHDDVISVEITATETYTVVFTEDDIAAAIAKYGTLTEESLHSAALDIFEIADGDREGSWYTYRINGWPAR